MQTAETAPVRSAPHVHPPAQPVVVFGASGHTGRFVTAELRRRGLPVILSGRNAEKLAAGDVSGLPVRVASVDDPDSLDRALAGAVAVINCAGPFLDTAEPVIAAALRAGAHYLDVTAEQAAALATFRSYDGPARGAGVTVVPAAGFYGGLADLLVTAAGAGWESADEARIAVALDSWRPTDGTRRTGERNTAARMIVTDGRLEVGDSIAGVEVWDFPAPVGTMEVVPLPMTEIVTISRHLPLSEIRSYMNQTPLTDLNDQSTPGPEPIDDLGRSGQRFMMDVHVRRGSRTRRATATGKDIYAVSAPLVAEAAERILRGQTNAVRGGAFALAELVDPRAFLPALVEAYPGFEYVVGP